MCLKTVRTIILVVLLLLTRRSMIQARQFAGAPVESTTDGLKSYEDDVSDLEDLLEDLVPEDHLSLPLFGKPLIIGPQLDSTLESRQDVALDPAAKDDVIQLEQELQVDFLYRLTERVALFLQGKLLYNALLDAENRAHDVQWDLARGETWLYIGPLFGSALRLQIGRQEFLDKREWWWNADLDAIRLHYNRGAWHAQVGIAQEVATRALDEARIAPDEKNVLRVLGRFAWEWTEAQWIEGFFLVHHDHSSRQALAMLVPTDRQDESDADLSWFGLRALGSRKMARLGRLDYWLDLASVVGHEIRFQFDEVDDTQSRVATRRQHAVYGWAVDAGVSWQSHRPWRPALTLGYAVGSGDSQPERGSDRDFRQTGLQDNSDRFAGVTRFHYYGELFQPELSNVHILTAALGFRLLPSSSVEFVYHAYWQVEPAPLVRATHIEAEPEGNTRHLGQEWNLVIGMQAWDHLEITLIGAAFRAGAAYGRFSGEMAYQITLTVEASF